MENLVHSFKIQTTDKQPQLALGCHLEVYQYLTFWGLTVGRRAHVILESEFSLFLVRQH